MTSTSRNRLVALVATALIGVGAYWYWSPHLAVRSMVSAARERDADAFNQYVDYPKVRESLKGQFNARMADALGDAGKSGSDYGKAGAALGAMLGMAVVERLIDAMVRPEMVMKAMSEAKMQSPADRASSEASASSDASAPKRNEVKWTFDRKGVDRVVAYGSNAVQGEAPKEQGVGFVFDRSGFATWKLTEIRVPSTKERAKGSM